MGHSHKPEGKIPTEAVTDKHDNAKLIKKKYLINKLNYINFLGGTVLVNLKHTRYNRTLSYRARPQPCSGDQLDCLWQEEAGPGAGLKAYRFHNLLVSNNQKLLVVESDLTSISKTGVSLLLPETCLEISSRTLKRHTCKGIRVQLIQNSALFYGSLIDFNSVSFRVEITIIAPQTPHWINPESLVNIMFFNDGETLYSGECAITKKLSKQNRVAMVLKSRAGHVQKFKHKKIRSKRHKLTPRPNILFKHPLTGKFISLKILDISSSGFSVKENEDNSVLISGMVIPEIDLSFANSFKIKCRVQVVYRSVQHPPEKRNFAKYGLAILNIGNKDHLELLTLMHQAEDGKAHFCNKVEPEKLWNFFFETGFIYPEKYSFLYADKEKIKKTYEKLYNGNPEIARHFIYQDRGAILGHLALLRSYNNAWLIHHHAARTQNQRKAGVKILSQVEHFISDSHKLNFMHMDYVICYFRPENKFPARIFGGAAQEINNPKICSVDLFALFHYRKVSGDNPEIPRTWSLTETSEYDLIELEAFYEHVSGGLMLEAIDLVPGNIDFSAISAEYKKAGFKRGRKLFSLKKSGRLHAVIMVNTTDTGINLSDLTNSIKIILLEPDAPAAGILEWALPALADHYAGDRITVLLFPATCAASLAIPCERIYTLWIIKTKFSDNYFQYLHSLFRAKGFSTSAANNRSINKPSGAKKEIFNLS